MKLLERVDGNKTYVIALLTVLYAVVGVFIGQLTWEHAIELALAGLAAAGFRSALNK